MKKERTRNLMIASLLCLSLSANACQARIPDDAPATTEAPETRAPEIEATTPPADPTAEDTQPVVSTEEPSTANASTAEETSAEATMVVETSEPTTAVESTPEATKPEVTTAEETTPEETTTEPETTVSPETIGAEYLDRAVIRYLLSAEDELLSDLGFHLTADSDLTPAIGFDAIYSLPVKRPGHADTDAYLVDFAGDHGYVIVDDDFNLYAVRTEGDVSALAGYTDLCYAMTDGLIYMDGNTRMNADRAVTLHPTPKDGFYASRMYDNEGGILDTAVYIDSRYPEGYTLERKQVVDFEQLYLQKTLSVFYTQSGRSESGEGNCTLSAIYTCLDILGRTVLKDTALRPALDETITIDVVNDPNYPKYADDPSYIFKPYIDLPLVYSKIRDHVIRDYDYTEGVMPWVNETLFNEILDEYDCGMKAVNHYAWTYQESIIPALDAGLPVQFSIANTQDYGDHSISILGYEYWSLTRPVYKLNRVESLFFLTVADNWTTLAVGLDTNIEPVVGNIITFERK
ncbi:MAG: hypothetical protein IK125_09935 [Lachnospiraceae bacterium]|nr:hypothetical protein [Lachnospiraceae bacterium]